MVSERIRNLKLTPGEKLKGFAISLGVGGRFTKRTEVQGFASPRMRKSLKKEARRQLKAGNAFAVDAVIKSGRSEFQRPVFTKGDKDRKFNFGKVSDIDKIRRVR